MLPLLRSNQSMQSMSRDKTPKTGMYIIIHPGNHHILRVIKSRRCPENWT